LFGLLGGQPSGHSQVTGNWTIYINLQSVSLQIVQLDWLMG